MKSAAGANSSAAPAPERHSTCLVGRVLSPEILSGNIDALVRAQGVCPTLGALPPAMRVVAKGEKLRVELRSAKGQLHTLGLPFAGGIGSHSPIESDACRAAAQVVIVGSALCEVLDNDLRAGHLRKILLVEPDPGLATLFLSRRDWRRWLAGGRLRLLTGPDFRGATTVARFLDGLKEIPIVADIARETLQPDVMSAARTASAERVVQNAVANGNARRKFAGPYLLQTLTNLPAIAREATPDRSRARSRVFPRWSSAPDRHSTRTFRRWRSCRTAR